jgi:pyrroline-5-carboxylate reductase
MPHQLGIIGAGNMAEAIVRGVVSRNVIPASAIIAADVSDDRRKLFETQLKVKAVEDNLVAARDVEVLLLSIKPQMAQKVLGELGQVVSERTLVVSIMAGIGSAFIEKHLGNGKKWRVIRTMPNTPMLLGEGMVAMARGANATENDSLLARNLFEAAATVIEVTEEKMDAVTAVSGSGPAYFFYLVEKMVAAGIELGLTPEEAHTLATKTALGAGKMLATSSDSPAELRRKVTSPNGTTHAAITHLEQTGAGKQMIEAVKAAARRSKELGL